jgi:nitroreductase
MSETVLRVMRERQSTRTPFNPERKVSKRDLEVIMQAARWAPTAHNMQNFEVIAIDDAKELQTIGKITSKISETFLRESYEQLSSSKEELMRKGTGVLGASFPPSWRDPSRFHEISLNTPPRPLSDSMQGSPLVLIVVYDPRKRAPASARDFLGVISLGCVMENIWLAAQSLGISAQILSVFNIAPVERKLKKILGVPGFMKIAYAIRLGYPIIEKRRHYLRVRRPISNLEHSNGWER